MSDRPPLPPRPAGGVGQVLLTFLARLRFVAILVAIGFVIVRWDELKARYDKWARPASTEVAADPDSEWFCPMHPAVVRDNPKDKCPICFMPLSKRRKGEASDAALPPGVVSRVQLTPYRVVLAGVRTSPVGYVPLTKEIVTVGTVEFDERGLKHVAARVKGRIETLVVNQTGQMVHKGDELAEMYSPDLVSTVQNLVDAKKLANPELERIARDRLKLWGLDDDQINGIAKTGKPVTHVKVRSPIDGHVIRKYQTEGRYVEEGGPLYDVADLRTVWVQAQVYEDDLGFLPAGHEAPAKGDRLPVTATTPAFPGESFAGALSFVFPHVDQETRTLTVRFELDNPNHKLRPGMTATVALRLSPDRLPEGSRLRLRDGNVLAVPEASVIDTGSRKVVYRQDLPGEFEGVAVELGPRMDGPGGAPFFPVLAGLEAGERVVAAGSFLIDAETRLNPAAGSIYIAGSGSKSGPAPAVRPSTPEDEDAKIATALAKLNPEDRKLARAQGYCVVLDGARLGSMGVPEKVWVEGKPVFICCKSCTKQAQADPARTLARVEEIKRKTAAGRVTPAPPPDTSPSPAVSSNAPSEADIRAELEKLPAADRMLAEKQRFCPVTGERLGSMGVPQKLAIKGKTVFTCCRACNKEAAGDPEATFKKLEELKANPPGKP